VLTAVLVFGCQPQKPEPEPCKKLPFNGICGKEYAEIYEIHESLFGENPTIVVFNCTEDK
tara:strand:+ start:320 stop:499 length:180 start_codon:yes stop_codon:yes gene_type:complete